MLNISTAICTLLYVAGWNQTLSLVIISNAWTCLLCCPVCLLFIAEGIPRDTLSLVQIGLFVFMVTAAMAGIVFSIFCIIFNFVFRNRRWVICMYCMYLCSMYCMYVCTVCTVCIYVVCTYVCMYVCSMYCMYVCSMYCMYVCMYVVCTVCIYVVCTVCSMYCMYCM